MFDISELWEPSFPIKRKGKIVTFGSCFAQHFSRALVKRGFNWLDAEPAPDGVGEAEARAHNYGIFSARTANIYTTSLFLQWTKWALGHEDAPKIHWEKDGRIIDPFRPTIEPDGFGSVEEMLASRQGTIEAFRRAIMESNLFVFTLGLTESWWDKDGGFEYPACPGTIAGEFDPDKHEFVNQQYPEIRENLVKAIKLMREAREKGPRFLLTVSPVPLVATNSGNHVLVATMESKSILRAVAGNVAKSLSGVSYFPSYEIVNSAPFRGSFFEPNLRSVNPRGVDHVMRTFFAGLGMEDDTAQSPASAKAADKKGGKKKSPPKPANNGDDDDVVCEEELLEAFASDKGRA